MFLGKLSSLRSDKSRFPIKFKHFYIAGSLPNINFRFCPYLMFVVHDRG